MARGGVLVRSSRLSFRTFQFSNRKFQRLEPPPSCSKQSARIRSNREKMHGCVFRFVRTEASRWICSRCILVRMLELDCGLEFFADFASDFFAALPARPGIFLLEMRGAGTEAAAGAGVGAQPYLARTADIRRAAERLLGAPDTASKQLNLREVAARNRYRVTGSKFEQNLAFYQNARLYFPSRYRELMRLRPPAMLKVNLRNSYPRCYVTRRIRADEGFYFGPFGSRRSAEDFSESFLDLFKTRRCQIKIRRDPAYPGCMYSEMKMCLAPCFAGCTAEEYDVEIGRVLESLETMGASLTEQLAQERAAASDELDFERAAALHKRLDKVAAVLRGMPDLARRIEELDLVILQRSAEPQTIAVFPVRGGTLEEPLFLRFAEISSEPRSVEAILKDALEPGWNGEGSEAAAGGRTRKRDEEEADVVLRERNLRARYGLRAAAPDLHDHLALLTRWFYSKPREGEILFRDKVWPYRRMLRACSRLLAGPQHTQGAPHPQQ
jgi:excinuclease ABC subunit C